MVDNSHLASGLRAELLDVRDQLVTSQAELDQAYGWNLACLTDEDLEYMLGTGLVYSRNEMENKCRRVEHLDARVHGLELMLSLLSNAEDVPSVVDDEPEGSSAWLGVDDLLLFLFQLLVPHSRRADYQETRTTRHEEHVARRTQWADWLRSRGLADAQASMLASAGSMVASWLIELVELTCFVPFLPPLVYILVKLVLILVGG